MYVTHNTNFKCLFAPIDASAMKNTQCLTLFLFSYGVVIILQIFPMDATIDDRRSKNRELFVIGTSGRVRYSTPEKGNNVQYL